MTARKSWHVLERARIGAVRGRKVTNDVQGKPEQCLAPPLARTTGSRDTDRGRIVRLCEIADALPDNPVIPRKSGRSFRERAEKLGAREPDLLSFFGNYVLLKVGMPFAETADNQAAVGDA